MENNDHTIKSWELRIESERPIIFVKGTMFKIAEISTHPLCKSEDKANAHLIEAAPKLLDALEVAQELISHASKEQQKQIKQAIKQARGQL
jgi:hypothetical protein